MMLFVAAVFLMISMVLALYLFQSGVFNTSYMRAFRFAFYVLLVVFGLTVRMGLFQLSNEVYDKTAGTP
jgi:hypothetical protein